MDVTCPCGATFQAKNRRAKYCSDRCRKRAQRTGDVVEIAPASGGDETPEIGPVEEATIRTLDQVDRLETPLGRACVVLARRLDNAGVDTGSALASVAGRLESTLAAATRGTGGANSPQQLRDELAERRAKHA
jgi:hypothetical protein